MVKTGNYRLVRRYDEKAQLVEGSYEQCHNFLTIFGYCASEYKIEQMENQLTTS